ncbi:hypothetical protein FA95DRAFT_1553949 [Auriscalpium vulgare]|uniref:Uncharacterized protein n=1 Tax=Auriscalpium vulgare TaxID=40419 RepID=A0ACB8S654_9AGAM|nr:hypothetical protein FA95DRAFT_1553949 [Auriscalpium vulgare]
MNERAKPAVVDPCSGYAAIPQGVEGVFYLRTPPGLLRRIFCYQPPSDLDGDADVKVPFTFHTGYFISAPKPNCVTYHIRVGAVPPSATAAPGADTLEPNALIELWPGPQDTPHGAQEVRYPEFRPRGSGIAVFSMQRPTENGGSEPKVEQCVAVLWVPRRRLLRRCRRAMEGFAASVMDSWTQSDFLDDLIDIIDFSEW